jgi:hypothetical protein
LISIVIISANTLGNDVSEGGSAIDSTNMIHIFRGFSLPSGWVYRFMMYLSTAEPIKLQIWRPTPDKDTEFRLVGEIDFIAKDGPGLYSVCMGYSLIKYVDLIL